MAPQQTDLLTLGSQVVLYGTAGCPEETKGGEEGSGCCECQYTDAE